MASTDRQPTPDSGKMAFDTEAAAPPVPAAWNALSMADLTLRLLLFATTLTSIVVMAVSEQTKLVAVPLFPYFIPSKAKFTYSSAMIYFVAALSVACLYSLLSGLACLFSVSKPSPSARLLLGLACIDTL